MPRQVRAASGLAAVVLSGTVCFRQQGTLGLPCTSVDDCDVGQRCEQEICVEDGTGSTDSGSASTDTTDTADTTVTTTEGTCMEQSIPVALVHTRVVLVVEQSDSTSARMWDDDIDPTTPDVTLWRSIRIALEAELPEANAAVDLGLVKAPGPSATSVPDASACLVGVEPDVPVAPSGAATVLAALPPAESLGFLGAAPMQGAFALATTELGSLGSDPKAIVLLVDGAANCQPGKDPSALLDSPDETLQDVITLARVSGIDTFVVGVAIPSTSTPTAPDLEPDAVDVQAYLDVLAQAGGRTNPVGPRDYYAGDSSPQVQSALRDVLFAARSCIVPVPQMPMFEALLEVEVNGTTVPRVSTCTEGDGWRLSGNRIHFCGGWCDPLKQAGAATLHYRCP